MDEGGISLLKSKNPDHCYFRAFSELRFSLLLP